MLRVTSTLAIPDDEIELRAVRSQGAGGQNVNKVASAMHLRFDIGASSLPSLFKERLLKKGDGRITKEGLIVIKAQEYRTQERNRAVALERLAALIRSVTTLPKNRRPTKPSFTARQKRTDAKKRRGQIKALRGSVQEG